jgi:hypothetical protein
MISEDYLSRASKNWLDFNLVKFRYYEKEEELKKANEVIDEKTKHILDLELIIRQLEMQVEDYYC